MQPRNLDEFVGQPHILGHGKPLREAIERDSIVSLILYGPPGTGKTALAHIIARKTRAFFISLNAVTSGVGEIKEALKDARKADRVILFVDEIHRFNKLQQDALLPDVENGTVTLIGASTRNPFFSIIPALSSRSMIFQFFPLSEPEIKILLERALQDREKGVGDLNIKIEPGALDFIATASEGDARRALNTLEMGAFMIKRTKCSSYDIELAKLRKSKGCFGKTLNTRYRHDILERVPSYARGKDLVFPDWKQKFIKQNRALYRKHRNWISPWLPKIKRFPPSLQKFEWNCKGEERNIWKHVIQFRASGVRVKRPTTSPSLVAMTTTQVPIIAWEKRYMTIRECARLQSMDDLKILPSGTAAMAALGNAVNVKVAYLVLRNLLSLQ